MPVGWQGLKYIEPLVLTFEKDNTPMTFKEIFINPVDSDDYNLSSPSNVKIEVKINDEWRCIYRNSSRGENYYLVSNEAITATGIRFSFTGSNSVGLGEIVVNAEPTAGITPYKKLISPVVDIIDVPTKATVGEDLTLTGTVIPDNATNKQIRWLVKNAGTTGATIEGNVLKTTTAGTVIITAQVINGAADGPYQKDFEIVVNESPVTSDNLLLNIPFTTTLPDGAFFYGDLGNNPTAKPSMLTYLTDGQRIEEPTAGTQDGIVATGNTPFDMTFDLNGVKEIRSIVIGTKWFEQDGALMRTPSHVKVEIQNGSDEWVTVFDGDFEDAGTHKDIVLGVADGEAISASKLRITTTKREGAWGTALDEINASSKAPEGAVDGTMAIPAPTETSNVLLGVTYTTNITEGDGQFQPEHPDANGSRLTDGIKATTNGSGLDWSNPAYVGLTKNPEIVLTFDDLGGGKSIESINLGFIQNLPIMAYVPKAVKVEAKDAEGAWSEVKTANFKGESTGDNKVYEESITFDSPVVAYGLRFSFTPDAYEIEDPFAPKADGTWGWLFIDEIEAIGKDASLDVGGSEISGWGDGGSGSGTVIL